MGRQKLDFDQTRVVCPSPPSAPFLLSATSARLERRFSWQRRDAQISYHNLYNNKSSQLRLKKSAHIKINTIEWAETREGE